MATFSGNAAGYRVDILATGKIRVVDIDVSDGDTGKQILGGAEALEFADRTYQLNTTTDIRVNSTLQGHQIGSDIATLADGGYVIAWTGSGESFSSGEIYLQRYDAAGNALGGETRVNATVTDRQVAPSIAALADGGWVLTWTSLGQDGDDGGVYAQRYDASGNTVGGEVRVNTTTAGHQGGDDISALADGGYIVAWASEDADSIGNIIYTQRYDAAGNAVGGETRVDTLSSDHHQTEPAVTALADGGYVVTWESWNGFDIYARRYDAAGNALGSETRVNHLAAHAQAVPEIAALQDGGYVITWMSEAPAGGYNIYAQRYDTAGNASGEPSRVNATIKNHQSYPVITALEDGGYVIAWDSIGQDGDGSGVYVQRFDATGNAVGDETLVNSYTNSWQQQSAIAALPDGGFMVTWSSDGQDGRGYGVYARRFDADGNSVATGTVLEGTSIADVMNGGQGMQNLLGKDGDDTLNGGDGGDILEGGEGQDTLNAGDGHDVLYGGVGNDALNGGRGNDILLGSGGTDILNGGDGDDNQRGGAGQDTLNGNGGRDFLRGDDGNDVLNGNGGNDHLVGDGGNDILNGGAGNDFLQGGWYDSDTLTGGAGSDVFRLGLTTFSPVLLNDDTISDFSADEGDVIQLGHASFQNLVTPGALGNDNFVANSDGAAQDADDYIIYETDTGKLFYDADGNGAGTKIQFATVGVDAHPVLAAADFLVI